MSTLKVTNIQATGETASRPATGVFSTYINIDQDNNNVVRDSFNISSNANINGGIVSFTYTNDMGSSDEYITLTGVRDGSDENDTRMILGSVNSGYITASSQRMYCAVHTTSQAAGSPSDAKYFMMGVIGDLA